jgi:hypothetical protein
MSAPTAFAMGGSVVCAMLAIGGIASPIWYLKAAGFVAAICMGLLVPFAILNSQKDRNRDQ